MTTNELSEPLRRRNLPDSLRGMRPTPLKLAVGVFSACLLGIVTWLYLADDPLGGEPGIVLKLDGAKVVSSKGPANATPPAQIGPDDIVERNGGAGIKRTTNARPAGDKAGAGKPAAAGLIEDGPHGPLPRIAADGRRPADVYARPVPPAISAGNSAKIAIVIGGMGLSASGTAEAIERLDPRITFAFAPYANNITNWVARARQSGHEVMLQIPMEPFDYPDNDPGPYTLLSSLSPAENIQRLQWLLSRFTGYTGVMNYMGARFTSMPEALAPVADEFKARGLIFLDDGTSRRSRSAEVTETAGLDAGVADVVIDSIQTDQAIDDAIERLEQIAKDKGHAIAVGSGLPITLDRIETWAETLAQKGIVLVPVSALVSGTDSGTQ